MESKKTLDIVALRSTPQVISALAEILVETVANGGSVSFMHPLAPTEPRRRDQALSTELLLVLA